MYTITKVLKREKFMLNSENIKQAIDIQLTFIMKIKLQKEQFL